MTPLPPPEIPDYELLKRIGEGSYGEVWLARSIMGTLRAVKIVYRRAFRNERPFEREFEGIKRFEPVSQMNESQLKIFHVGRRAEYFYYVMELADDADAESRESTELGESGKKRLGRSVAPPSDSPPNKHDSYSPRTLRSEIERSGRRPVRETIEISLKLTQALAHLHQHGLVHRDVKPSNIIFVHGLPKLADIGLVADSEGTLTFVGTEGYLPPEGPGKPPADIFSLGKVLYELSTGQDRNQFPELPTRWDSAEEREDFAEFNEVIIKACAGPVEQRYATAEQMYEDLLLLRAGKSLQRVRTLERRLAWFAKAGAAALVVSLLVAAGYLYQRHLARTALRNAAQLQINNGLRLLDERDLQGSLIWLTAALQQEESYLSAAEEAQERTRIASVLERCPPLVDLIVPDVNAGALPPVLQHLPESVARGIPPGPPKGKVADYGGMAEFSPDGRQILVAGYGRTALLCDVATGKVLHRLEHRDNVQWGRFTGNGKRLITSLGETNAGVVKLTFGTRRTGSTSEKPGKRKTISGSRSVTTANKC